MYAWIWHRLPGRIPARAGIRAVIIVAVAAALWFYVFPWAALHLPIVGTVPAIKPAAALSKTRAIGVLGTDATIVQPYVDRLAAEFAADCTIVRHGSAELVALAEARLRGETTDPLKSTGRLIVVVLIVPFTCSRVADCASVSSAWARRIPAAAIAVDGFFSMARLIASSNDTRSIGAGELLDSQERSHGSRSRSIGPALRRSNRRASAKRTGEYRGGNARCSGILAAIEDADCSRPTGSPASGWTAR